VNAYLCVVTNFSEQVEAQSTLYSSSTSTPLSSIAFGNECFHKAADLSLLVESTNISDGYIKRHLLKTNLISRYFPVSITQVISGIVMPVSAILVAK
jgi:hypothetical protein